MLSEQGFSALIPIDDVSSEAQGLIGSFSCGTDSLDIFLREQAKDQHVDRLGHTGLLFHGDFDGLVGYITTSADAIPLKASEVGELGLTYDIELSSFPALKIGRLAVHKDLQRQHIGQRILDLTIGEIVGAKQITAARILITDAINDERVIRFYRKYGFEESYWARDIAKNHGGKRGQGAIKMIRDIYKIAG